MVGITQKKHCKLYFYCGPLKAKTGTIRIKTDAKSLEKK